MVKLENVFMSTALVCILFFALSLAFMELMLVTLLQIRMFIGMRLVKELQVIYSFRLFISFPLYVLKMVQYFGSKSRNALALLTRSARSISSFD